MLHHLLVSYLFDDRRRSLKRRALSSIVVGSVLCRRALRRHTLLLDNTGRILGGATLRYHLLLGICLFIALLKVRIVLHALIEF